jgi:hypothetical protein
VSTSDLPITHAALYSWEPGTFVDAARAVAGSGPNAVCVAPIVPGSHRGNSSYTLREIAYWAVASGCCGGGAAPNCTGWGEEWPHAINWQAPPPPPSY